MFSKCKFFLQSLIPFSPFILRLTTSNQSTMELLCKPLRITLSCRLTQPAHYELLCSSVMKTLILKASSVHSVLSISVVYEGFTYSIQCCVILITTVLRCTMHWQRNMWESAGNISEAAYVLSMIYFPFIFLYRTSSLSVCQIMCQILEVTRKGEK